MNNAPLDSNELRFVHTLQVLGDTTRFKMFKMMLEHQNLCVSDIAHNLEISVSAVSQHFRSFELLRLVTKQRQGQKICYLVNHDDPFVHQLYDFVQKST